MKLSYLGGLFGNVLEHYDHALFGLLAPFLAPLFFGNLDPTTALILTYGMLPLGVIARPLGSLFFGWIGDRLGRRQALFYSLSGMAFVTVSIGSLPLYKDIGVWAPIFLALGRLLQNFFAAGETIGGAIFVLEHTKKERRSWMSSFYDSLSAAGILIASTLVAWLSEGNSIGEAWRMLFWAGGITAIVGLFLRLNTQEGVEFTQSKKNFAIPLQTLLKEYRTPLLRIIIASGFFYTTFALAFTFMNGYIPLVTSLTKSAVVEDHAKLLFLDMLLLPLFGYFATRFGKEKIMLFGTLGACCSSLFLFSFLEQAGAETVFLIRALIILFGVAFAAPYHAWTLEQVAPQHRYTILSLGYAVGSQLIGATSPAICLFLYQQLQWSLIPGLYLMLIAGAASYVMYTSIASKRLATVH